MFKWTSLNKGLINSRDLGNGWFLWGIPILAIGIESFNRYFGHSVTLPTFLLVIFLVALPMVAAQAIYTFRCPGSLKSVESESQWREKADQERQQILRTIRRSDEIKNFLATKLEARLRTRPSGVTLTKEQISVVREEFKLAISDTYAPNDHDLDALKKKSIRHYHDENICRPISRMICSFFLSLAILAGAIEIALRVYDVLLSYGLRLMG